MENFGEEDLRRSLHDAADPIGADAMTPAGTEINLAAMRPEIEFRQTLVGRVGTAIMSAYLRFFERD